MCYSVLMEIRVDACPMVYRSDNLYEKTLAAHGLCAVIVIEYD